MKKRLLITSIVMMLVVAVALSTATYAWFTSNATVTASYVTMVATTSQAPALGISWTDGNYGVAITPNITSAATDETFVFSPVSPSTLYKTGAVPDNKTVTTDAFVFKTALTHSEGGDFIFNSNGTDAPHAAYTWKDDVSGTHTDFYVKNLSNTNVLTGNLTLTAVIENADDDVTSDGSDLIRVAVFKYNDSTSAFELLDVLANTINTFTVVPTGNTLTALSENGHYYKLVLGRYVEAVAGTAQEVLDGTADYEEGVTTAPANTFYTMSATQTHATAVFGAIGIGNSVNAMETYTCAESVVVATDLAADTAIRLKVVVWMDGAALGDAQQANHAKITLNFAVA